MNLTIIKNLPVYFNEKNLISFKSQFETTFDVFKN